MHMIFFTRLGDVQRINTNNLETMNFDFNSHSHFLEKITFYKTSKYNIRTGDTVMLYFVHI